VIARTGELLIERYQLYVQLSPPPPPPPRERRPDAREGGRGEREGGSATLADEHLNLNPSTWVSREGVLCNESSQI